MLGQLERLELGEQKKLLSSEVLKKMHTSNPKIYKTKVGGHRFFGGFVGSCYYITHAFPKKEQKARGMDINVAQKRLKDIMTRQYFKK